MGLDAKKSLTKMDKERNLKNGVGVEIINLNLIIVEEATKEVVNGKAKAVLEE